MKIVSQNPEERCSKYDDEFVNYWVPVIRKLRETTQFAGSQLLPSMNDCLDIMDLALKTYKKQQTTADIKKIQEHKEE